MKKEASAPKRPTHPAFLLIRPVLPLVLAIFGLALPAGATTLTYVGVQNIATGTVVDGAEVGGLSGISYNPYTDRFIAITDDSRSVGARRMSGWESSTRRMLTTMRRGVLKTTSACRTPGESSGMGFQSNGAPPRVVCASSCAPQKNRASNAKLRQRM